MDYARFNLPDFNAVPRRDYVLALVSGILLALSFPKPGLSFLAWIAFVPLLLACGKKDPKKAFRLGFVAGLAAYTGIMYWINIALVTYGHLPWPVSISVFAFLAAYIASFLGAAMYLVRKGEARGISPLFSFPVLWVGLEYVRAVALTGFPWANLGHSQYRLLPLIQISDLTGVFGISFLLALANVIVYRFIGSVAVRRPKEFPAKSLVILAILLAVSISYGYKQLNTPETGAPLNVSLIQGNIEQDVKWNPAFQEATISIYDRLSRQAVASGSDLIVWPESAAPFYFQDEAKYTDRIKQLAAETKSSIVVGSVAYEKKDALVKYLNSAFLVGPAGNLLGRSDKIHLVPFGEYVPLGKYFPFISKIVTGIGDFSPGAAALPLDTGKGKIGVLICFEGIFPELARAYVKAGSGLLVNITNDAWYKRSSAPYQHLSMTVFRAVENRVPLIRAANTGVTAIIDSKGRIQGATPIFQEAFLNGQVRLGTERTLYTRFGDIFAGICLALTFIIATFLCIPKKP